MTNNNSTPNSTARTEPAIRPTGNQTETSRPTQPDAQAAQPRASKSLEYMGQKVRFHLDGGGCAWFVIVDIFRALKTFKKAKLRAKIKDRTNVKEVLAWIPNSIRPWDSGDRMVQATNLNGIAAMATYRTVPGTADFLAWLQADRVKS